MTDQALAIEGHEAAPATLSGIAGNTHFAQFYIHDETLVDSVAAYVIQNVGDGAGAIVIATAQHLEAFEARWADLQFDAAPALATGQLVLLEANQALAMFMEDGEPDRDRFMRSVGQAIARGCERYGRLAADREIQRSMAHMAAIVESSDDAIISKTLEGVIESWNKGAQDLFGYTPEEAIGKSIALIIPPELLDEEQQILSTLRRGERIEHFETTRITKAGRRVEISLTLSPIRNDAGAIIGASKIARDISERKRAERLLREADQRKDEFLALLAHELRNPLAPIRYALAANRKPGRTPEQRRWADEIMERQVAHMSRLLDDLLDISRVTRGTLELKKAPAELVSVLSAAIETARPLLDSKHHSLSLDFPNEAVRLDADAVRLAQVFSNLLINAAKYTEPQGNIRLSACRKGAEVIVSVRDDGIGIAPDMMPRLFTMFAQGDGARGRTDGGLGVGLALVRGLVALHGGTVCAHSEGVGCGSEFTVRLPIGEPPAGLACLDTVDGSASAIVGRILVVDDNHDVADTCAALLRASGRHIRTAYTGREALNVAASFRPHAVLLDIGLPDLDGYTVAKRIREMKWAKRVLLIAVTGWGQAEHRRRAQEAGFDHHLAKPVAADALESALQLIDAGSVG